MIIRKIHIEITILIWVPFLETILNLESQKEISNLDPKTKNNPGCQKEKKKKKKKKKKKTRWCHTQVRFPFWERREKIEKEKERRSKK